MDSGQKHSDATQRIFQPVYLPGGEDDTEVQIYGDNVGLFSHSNRDFDVLSWKSHEVKVSFGAFPFPNIHSSS
jgi:hypothetical protein